MPNSLWDSLEKIHTPTPADIEVRAKEVREEWSKARAIAGQIGSGLAAEEDSRFAFLMVCLARQRATIDHMANIIGLLGGVLFAFGDGSINRQHVGELMAMLKQKLED